MHENGVFVRGLEGSENMNSYVIATGSDEMTSRTFSQPSVVIYNIE